MMSQLLDFFISSAHAESTAAAATTPTGGIISMLPMMLVILLFFYFAIWRPQSKRAREQQDLITSLAKGDEVVTAGGIIGRIAKIQDNYLAVSVGNNDIILQKSAVVSVLPKGTLKTIE